VRSGLRHRGGCRPISSSCAASLSRVEKHQALTLTLIEEGCGSSLKRLPFPCVVLCGFRLQ